MQQATLRQNTALLLSSPFNRVIDTPRITLQPITRDFVSEIHTGYTQEVAKFLFAQPCRGFSGTEKRIEQAIAQMTAGVESNFQIRENGSYKFIGCANLQHTDEHPIPVLWIMTEWQNKGYGTEAMRALHSYANRFLKYEFIEAKVVINNYAGKRILEKCGAKSLPYLGCERNESGDLRAIYIYHLYP